MGYRWYDTRRLPTRFPFGHGLSYTTFELGVPEVTAGAAIVTLTVPVTNTGDRHGSEVVQCYVAPPRPTRLARPVKELKAYAKVALDPGEQSRVTLTLDQRAFAYWDPERPGWRVDPGRYELHVGRSSADIAHVVSVER
jgi:beta-glucosidase